MMEGFISKKLASCKMNIWLVGYMGAGKSTMAQNLGAKLHAEVVDTDAAVETLLNLPVSKIFAKYGEHYFRVLERHGCLQLSQQDHMVIATGGGVPQHSFSIAEMKKTGICSFLCRDIAELWNRVQDNPKTRPLVQSQVEFISRYQIRQPIYQQADYLYAGDDVEELLNLIAVSDIK